MDCESCLNLQTDGLCGVYGKEPPEGFAARCLRFAETQGCHAEEPEATKHLQHMAGDSSPAARNDSKEGGKRLCLAEYCPFLVTELPGSYCMARILPDRTEYLKLEEETPCPRHWTI